MVRCARVPDIQRFRDRKRFFDGVRKFFDKKGFLEVDTPVVVPSPGLEPHLLAFETEFTTSKERNSSKLYLHTSPEYAMKRMLAHGAGDIYQIARVFRDEPISNTHNPEFTMLEFYRCPGDLDMLMQDVKEFLFFIAEVVDGPWRPRDVEKISVSDAFRRVGLCDPLGGISTDHFRSALPIRTHEDDTWEDLFHRAMFECVEPSFDPECPTILYGYPASMAALSRIDPNDQSRCLRFEVFAGSLELGNAFDELVDPVLQRERFVEENDLRKKLGRPSYPIDEDLVEDLGQIADASGIAIGLDRLLMLCLGKDRLSEVLSFPPEMEGN